MVKSLMDSGRHIDVATPDGDWAREPAPIALPDSYRSIAGVHLGEMLAGQFRLPFPPEEAVYRKTEPQYPSVTSEAHVIIGEARQHLRRNSK
jgi:hypothetical protein